MALALNVDSLDAVNENLRPLYVEKDGKFVLDVDGIEDTSALKGALQKERKEREAKERQIKAWEKLGKTPDDIAELLEAQQARDLSEAERKGEWDKLKAQMNTAHQTELAKKDESISAMRKQIQ